MPNKNEYISELIDVLRMQDGELEVADTLTIEFDPDVMNADWAAAEDAAIAWASERGFDYDTEGIDWDWH